MLLPLLLLLINWSEIEKKKRKAINDWNCSRSLHQSPDGAVESFHKLKAPAKKNTVLFSLSLSCSVFSRSVLVHAHLLICLVVLWSWWRCQCQIPMETKEDDHHHLNIWGPAGAILKASSSSTDFSSIHYFYYHHHCSPINKVAPLKVPSALFSPLCHYNIWFRLHCKKKKDKKRKQKRKLMFSYQWVICLFLFKFIPTA